VNEAERWVVAWTFSGKGDWKWALELHLSVNRRKKPDDQWRREKRSKIEKRRRGAQKSREKRGRGRIAAGVNRTKRALAPAAG
jgi:hypothetical protein